MPVQEILFAIIWSLALIMAKMAVHIAGPEIALALNLLYIWKF
jgi:hypothetical protein